MVRVRRQKHLHSFGSQAFHHRSEIWAVADKLEGLFYKRREEARELSDVVHLLLFEVRVGPVAVHVGSDVLPHISMGVLDESLLFIVDSLRVSEQDSRIKVPNNALIILVLQHTFIEVPFLVCPELLSYLLVRKPSEPVKCSQDIFVFTQFKHHSFIFINDRPVQRKIKFLFGKLLVFFRIA